MVTAYQQPCKKSLTVVRAGQLTPDLNGPGPVSNPMEGKFVDAGTAQAEHPGSLHVAPAAGPRVVAQRLPRLPGSCGVSGDCGRHPHGAQCRDAAPVGIR